MCRVCVCVGLDLVEGSEGRRGGTGEHVGVDVGDAGGFGGCVCCGQVLVYRSALG